MYLLCLETDYFSSMSYFINLFYLNSSKSYSNKTMLLLGWSNRYTNSRSLRTGWSLWNIHFSNGNGSCPFYVDLLFHRQDFYRIWLNVYKCDTVGKVETGTAYPSRASGFTIGYCDGVPVANLFSVLCCVLFCLSLVFVLCPMLPVSLNRPFFISPFDFP